MDFEYISALESFYDDQITYIEGMNNITIMESGSVFNEADAEEAKKGLFAKAKTAIMNFIEKIKTALDTAWGWVSDKLKSVKSKLDPYIDKIKNNKVVSAIVNSVVFTTIEKAVSGLRKKVDTWIGTQLQKMLRSDSDSAMGAAMSYVDKSKQYQIGHGEFLGAIEGMEVQTEKKEATVGFVYSAAEKAGQWYKKITDELNSILDSIKKRINDAGVKLNKNSIGKYIMRGITAIGSAVNFIKTKAMNAVGSANGAAMRVVAAARKGAGKDAANAEA